MSSASQDLTPLPVALTRGGHRPQLDALRYSSGLSTLGYCATDIRCSSYINAMRGSLPVCGARKNTLPLYR